MDIVVACCAGLDVHKKTVVACRRCLQGNGKVRKEVRTFGTMTADLLALSDWLAAAGVTEVALESTGVYWKPIWNILETRFQMLLVNARHIKQVPGRKSDVKDSEWIAELLQHGLLRGSFIPPAAQRELRELTRQRTQLVRQKATVSNRIQKVLEDANIKLASVASDVLGLSGRLMLEAIIAGQDDPAVLADIPLGTSDNRAQLPCPDRGAAGPLDDQSSSMAGFLIYGANGYTGELIARAALVREHQPVLAGRNATALTALASNLGLEHRTFALDDPGEIENGIRDVRVVLHCAGPFARTSRPMADACLRTRTHYLDITGEAAVFESLAARDAEARTAGVMLLPGAGFDVVPSDCLAAHLKRRLPSATHLALGFSSLGSVSRGTALTIAENIHRGGLVRREGVLRKVPTAWKTRTIDFGTGPVKAITIPWGDVVTAYYSTGIPNIEVYSAASWGRRLAARTSRHLGWLLGSPFVQKFLKRRILAGPSGPTDEERARGRSFLWGEATSGLGRRVVSRLRGPESYTMTVRAALAIVERVLSGEAPPGFQTPSRAFGPDFVRELEDVNREDD